MSIPDLVDQYENEASGPNFLRLESRIFQVMDELKRSETEKRIAYHKEELKKLGDCSEKTNGKQRASTPELMGG